MFSETNHHWIASARCEVHFRSAASTHMPVWACGVRFRSQFWNLRSPLAAHFVLEVIRTALFVFLYVKVCNVARFLAVAVQIDVVLTTLYLNVIVPREALFVYSGSLLFQVCWM